MTRLIRHRLMPLPVMTGAVLCSATAGAADLTPIATAAHPHDETGHAPRASEPATNAEHVRVVGHLTNTLLGSAGLSRMPQDVLHTPQNINVVPQQLMREQNVKSLDEALRNVPGVTASIGEGAGGMNGDQFLIRGFPAQNDIYEDGLRDFGVYTRDSFNIESVSVIKGPSSEVFGNGTTGGAINMVTKAPTLLNHYDADFTGGSAGYYRGTFDFDQQLDASTALRIEGMGNEGGVVGRDRVFSHRWGVAPSLAFGLGRRTTLVLQYLHEQDDSMPDYGVPILRKPGASYSLPATEYGVRRGNWYGTDADHNASNDNLETARLTYRLSPHVTLYDDLRGGQYYRSFGASKATCDATCSANYFGPNPLSALIARAGPSGAGNGAAGGSRFAPLPYDQSSWSVQNVASMVANFHTAFLRHQLVGGFDLERVNDTRGQSVYLRAKPFTSLVNPNPHVGDLMPVPGGVSPGGLVVLEGLGAKPNSNGYGFDTGIFINDQIWFTSWLSIKGGLRWDRWQTTYDVTGGDLVKYPDRHFHNVSNIINPNASLVITPDAHSTYYFTWASSTTPMGMYVTNGSIPIRPPGNEIGAPERAHLYELGAKYSAFHDRMGFTAALFRLDKNNATDADPLSGQLVSTGDTQRNQGLELSATGTLTRNWTVNATYALYDSSVLSSLTRSNVGNNVPYVPHNQATLWTAYEAFAGTPANVSVGGGVTWRQHVWLDAANSARVPANLSIDTMIAHRFGDHWRLALNAYNLTNRLNYQSLFANRATPSIGRTFLGQISMSY